MLREKLESMGIVVTPEDLKTLFARFDTDGTHLPCGETSRPTFVIGSGSITFQELVSRVMPRDYTRTPWNIIRDDEVGQIRAGFQRYPTICQNDKIEREKAKKWLAETSFTSLRLDSSAAAGGGGRSQRFTSRYALDETVKWCFKPLAEVDTRGHLSKPHRQNLTDPPSVVE